MEAKKTESADLTNKSSFFFSIGLVVTLAVTLTAFEWKQMEEQAELVAGKTSDNADEIMEVPPTEQPPPPPPQVQQPQVVEVPDEEEIEEEIQVNLDVEMNEETKVEQIEIKVEEPKEDVDEIFTIVEETATPKGGMAAFYKYVGSKLKYPSQATRMGVEGKVYVEFVINRDGTIVDVRVVRGIGAGCDEEAVRVVQSSPAWNPGKQRGKPVRQKYTLPIQFKLQ
ncbi:MAG: energy transducer TonB [Bacteroidetes bacterium]|nr:energy transducer TonB [Bacteroidota bacterium]